jgi:hypothetical protein
MIFFLVWVVLVGDFVSLERLKLKINLGKYPIDSGRKISSLDKKI